MKIYGRKYLTKAVLTVFCSIAVIAFISCPTPLSKEMALQVKDTIAPGITILSPADGSYCAKTVVVSGIVSDASTENDDTGELSSLSYEILSSALSGEIPINEDETFSFSFSTTTLSSTFVLKLTASDWNDNYIEKSITLKLMEGNDIPSFTVSPGDREVTLEWSSVPNTSRYDLYYTTNGTQPSESYGEVIDSVTSPYTLEGLQNGNMHVFLLKAVPEDTYPENWSDYVRAIPLSEYQLTPTVTGQYKQIRIEWPVIPADDEYEVYRSTNYDSGYTNITGTYTGTIFIDTDVVANTWYYYRINPAFSNEIQSIPIGSQVSPFPPEPYLLRTVDLGYTGNNYLGKIRIVDDRAYAATSGGGFHILDISAPASAYVIKTVNTYTNDIAVAGDYAYIANYTDGLEVIKISDPDTASVIKTIYTSTPYAIAVNSGYAFLGTNAPNIYIFNIGTDPSSPSFIKTLAMPTRPIDIEISGGYGYIADYDAGLIIIDNTNTPADSEIIHTVSISSTKSVDISGNYAYVAAGTGGLKIISIQEPVSASIKKTITTTGSVEDVAVSGGYAYVTDSEEGLVIVDITQPESAFIVKNRDVLNPQNIAVSGNYAFVGDKFTGLQIFDIKVPTSAAPVKSVNTTGTAKSVAITGPYAFIGDDSEGLQVIDITSPESASLIKTVETSWPSYVNDAAIAGNYAYLAAGETGLQIIDISTMETASIVKTIPTTDANGVTISGDYAYVADYSSGLRIIDISSPLEAAIVKSLDTTGYAQDVAVFDTYAYVADYSPGLQIIDISTPSTASVIKTVDTTRAVGVTVLDNHAYVADGAGGLQIIDISTPASASIVRTVPISTFPHDVSVSSGYAYVAATSGGIKIVDISTPSSALVIGSSPTADYAYDIAVAGNYAYAADREQGLQIIKLSP